MESYSYWCILIVDFASKLEGSRGMWDSSYCHHVEDDSVDADGIGSRRF